MTQVPFEGISFDAEAICRCYGNAEDFIAKAGHQFFAGSTSQHAKMTTVYDLCCKAVGKETAPAPKTRSARKPATEEPITGEGDE